MNFFILGVVLLVLVLLVARAFVRLTPAHLAQGLRAFVAAFGTLASTGLLFTGRFGLAMITIAAMVMAIKAMRRSTGSAPGGVGGFGASTAGGQGTSDIATDTLRMELNHATGDLDGEVLRGQFAGRSLESLGLSDLLDLIADCQLEDPRSVALLETYLDRRYPDWRGDAGSDDHRRAPGSGGSPPMDEAVAWSVLGLAPGASADDIKLAHRKLMTKLHPDHGGSSYLAAQLNQAKDLLLERYGG